MTSLPNAWQGRTAATHPQQTTLSAVPSRFDPPAPREFGTVATDCAPVTVAALERDFAYASALLDGAERMCGQSDLPSLLSVIAADASTLVHDGDVAVIQYSGMRRLVSSVHVPGQVDDSTFIEAVRAAGEEPWLVTAESIADLNDDVRWTGRGGPLAAVAWRSVMTVPLLSWNPQDQTRLVWLSETPEAFNEQAKVAALFSRHANLAIHYLGEQRHLTLAITARHRIGQAQGILMARHRITAEEAFQALRRESQHTNVKLRTIADRVISNGS